MTLTRRVAIGLLAGLPAAARAQSVWPSGATTIIVPFPAGGSVDALARLAQPILQEKLGVPVIVENK